MSHPRSRAHAFQHGDDERTAQTEPTAAVVCPACGHMLSMFTEPAVTLPERIASQMAAFFGSDSLSWPRHDGASSSQCRNTVVGGRSVASRSSGLTQPRLRRGRSLSWT